MMKNLKIWMLCALIAVLATGCDKDKDRLFEMDMFFELDVPIGLNTLESHFFTIEDVPTFIDGHLSTNNVSPDDIESITGATGEFTTRLTGIDLDFVETIGVFVLDKNDPTIRRELFYIFGEQIPFGTKTQVQLTPSIVNVKDFFLDETVDIEFKINFRGFSPQVLDVRVEMKFFAFQPE